MAQPLLHPMGEESLRPHPAPVARAAADTPPRWALRAANEEEAVLRPVDEETLRPVARPPASLPETEIEEDPPLFAPLPDPEIEPEPAPPPPPKPHPPRDDSRDAVPTSQMPLPVCVPLDVNPFAPRRRVWPWVLGAALCALAVLGWRIFGTLK